MPEDEESDTDIIDIENTSIHLQTGSRSRIQIYDPLSKKGVFHANREYLSYWYQWIVGGALYNVVQATSQLHLPLQDISGSAH